MSRFIVFLYSQTTRVGLDCANAYGLYVGSAEEDLFCFLVCLYYQCRFQGACVHRGGFILDYVLRFGEQSRPHLGSTFEAFVRGLFFVKDVCGM